MVISVERGDLEKGFRGERVVECVEREKIVKDMVRGMRIREGRDYISNRVLSFNQVV